jgi:hypothetical protein
MLKNIKNQWKNGRRKNQHGRIKLQGGLTVHMFKIQIYNKTIEKYWNLKTQADGIGSGAFRRLLGHKGRSHRNGLVSL